MFTQKSCWSMQWMVDFNVVVVVVVYLQVEAKRWRIHWKPSEGNNQTHVSQNFSWQTQTQTKSVFSDTVLGFSKPANDDSCSYLRTRSLGPGLRPLRPLGAQAAGPTHVTDSPNPIKKSDFQEISKSGGANYCKKLLRNPFDHVWEIQ